MQTTTPKLANITPITGRMVNEQDEVHNVLDSYGNVKTVGIENTAVHNGTLYQYIGANLIATGATAYLMLVTAAKYVHMSGNFIRGNTSPVLVNFYEDAVTSNNGIEVQPTAKNRVNVIAPTAKLYAAPTVTSDGVLLNADKIIAGSGGDHKAGGSQEQAGEWLLKPNTKYLFKVTNQSNGTFDYVGGLTWIETDD
jgi:hypothetical protein